jgi:hypothetical protein
MSRLLLLLLVVVALNGCQHSLRPPAQVANPATVYVIDYGQHASLALPRESRSLVEWSWGDWNWFAKGRTDLGSGLRALFSAPRSTLSRREITPVPTNIRARVGEGQVIPLIVERQRSDALLARLQSRWDRGAAQALTHPDGRIFVPDPARYSLGNNSVHELRRWLEALDVDVRGSALTARFRVEERRAR